MLTEMRLENYRCFKSATLRLTPLTVLVGQNSSGKSTLLKALGLPGLPEDDFWQHDPNLLVRIQHLSVQGSAAVRQTGAGRGHSMQVDPSYRYQFIHLDLKRIREPAPTLQVEQLESDGYRLATAFLTLSRQQQQEAAREIVRLVPAFSDVDVVPTSHQEGYVQMRFHDRWNPGVWYSPLEVSDGTMLVTAYVLLQFQRSPPTLIALEEPERGVHPYLLGELVGLWRKMSAGEIANRQIQIVLATHSAELLEYVEPDEVRFLSRDPKTGEGRIQEAPTNDEHWRDAYATYQESLGGMWLSGGLGGVPGR